MKLARSGACEEAPNELTALVFRQLDEYFAGTRRTFDFPCRLHGTPFQQRVWAALREIPYGETRSYKQLAEAIGQPNACRAAGMANHANPILIAVPCHRVICADGSLGGYAGGTEMKKALLRLEQAGGAAAIRAQPCLQTSERGHFMIYTVTLNPALDKTVEIPGMALDTVNRITEMRTDPGGKGINVSKVIAKLGGESCAAGILGGESGKMLEKLLENENFTTQFRFVEGQTRTNLKIIDREGHTNTDINEPGLTVTDADLDALLHDLLAEVHAGDIVVLAGSLPKGAPQDTYRTWTAACQKRRAHGSFSTRTARCSRKA